MPTAADLLARAFDADAAPPEDPTTSRILDAALALVAASGMRHLTVDDVAERAQVGRMTVYRRFGTRQRLLDALAIREAKRTLQDIATSFDPADPLPERAADVLVAVLRVVREHPLLARLARVEPDAFLHELTRNDSEVFALVRGFLMAEIAAAQHDGELLPGADPALLAELALRLGASFVLIPDGVLSGRDDDDVRATARELLAPLAGPRR
jgi:AcrR family transcriptional regulator